MDRKFCSQIIVFAIFLSGFLPIQAFCQSFGTAGAFSRMGFSPRGISMGNAMSASPHGQTPASYNPALSAVKSEFTHFDISTAALKFDRNLHTASVQVQLPPSAGLSFNIINASVGRIDGRNSSGYHTDMLSTSEFKFAGQFGIRFSEAIHAGIGISYFLANYHPEVPNASSIGLDIGLLIYLNENIQLAAVAKDLLAAYDFDTSDLYGGDTRTDTKANFPAQYIAGISIAPGSNISITGEFEIRNSSLKLKQAEEMAALQNNLSAFFRSGIEYAIHERFTLRAGIQANEIGHEINVQPGGGFSLHLPYDRYSPSIDYAFVREPSGISTMHIFALRFQI